MFLFNVEVENAGISSGGHVGFVLGFFAFFFYQLCVYMQRHYGTMLCYHLLRLYRKLSRFKCIYTDFHLLNGMTSWNRFHKFFYDIKKNLYHSEMSFNISYFKSLQLRALMAN